MTAPSEPTPSPSDPHRDAPETGKPGDAAPASDGTDEQLPVAAAPQPVLDAPEARVADDSASATAAAPAAKSTQRERIALAFFGALLLVVAIWLLRSLGEQIPTIHGQDGIRFPVSGTHATLADAETYWRRPIVTGENPDRFRHGARLLPVLRLTLANDSGSGALRIFFRDPNGTTVGDPTTLSFSAGRFTHNGQAAAEITATDGFHQDGMHAAYQAGEGRPWIVDLREAPAATSSPAEFLPLLEIPISSERR